MSVAKSDRIKLLERAASLSERVIHDKDGEIACNEKVIVAQRADLAKADELIKDLKRQLGAEQVGREGALEAIDAKHNDLMAVLRVIYQSGDLPDLIHSLVNRAEEAEGMLE